jgi:type II secretory ATPase GspE/PulE/Tfp pilus assembly ATPase PilB-like protein
MTKVLSSPSRSRAAEAFPAARRRPQDGRIRTRTPEGKEIELRVSALPTAFGEKMVLRIFNPDVLTHDFDRSASPLAKPTPGGQ